MALLKGFPKKLRCRNKPWITFGISKSASTKNSTFTKCIKLKDVNLKNEAQNTYKQYRKHCILY